MLRTLVCCLLTLFCHTPRAQEAPKPPAALGSLAKMLGKKAKAPTDHPTRFQPTGKALLLNELADALGQDAEQRTALREALVAGSKAVEQQLANAGHPNDAAAAIAFAIAYSWGLWKGTEVSDPASEALLAQLHASLGADFRALTDTDKQRVHEYGIGLGVFLVVMAEATAEDAEAKQGLGAFAAEILKQLLGADPALFELTDAGLQPAAGAVAAATAAANARLAVGTPDGWLRESDDGTVVLTHSLPTRNRNNEALTLRVIALEQGAPCDDIEKALHGAYDKLLRPLIPADAMDRGVKLKEVRPDLCRRLIGNGLRCHFAGVSWSKREDSFDYFGTTQELHLYFVESGGAWFPIVAQLSGMKGELADGKHVEGWARYDWLEAMWATTRGEAGKAPLFTTAELTGKWELGSSTAGPFYYNAVTGASLGMGMVVRNHKVDLRADGTWSSVFVGGSGIGTVAIGTQKESGTWQLQNDATGCFLVRDRGSSQPDRARLAGRYRLPDGNAVYLVLRQDQMSALPNVWADADRYFARKD